MRMIRVDSNALKLSMIVIMIGIIAQDHHRSKYDATQPFIHGEKKKKPSDKEGLLPNGCTGNPLSIDDPRFIHFLGSVKLFASLFKR